MSHKMNKKGFTIIEVLIVLAIAGLILLIVFLAVPALQRNARNTAIKNDVQNVLGGVSDYENANNGAFPTTVGGTGTINYSGSSGTNPTSIKVQGSTQVVQATSGAKPTPPGGTGTSATTAPTPGTIKVYLGVRCDGSGSTRAVSAEYSIETSSSGAVYQCQDS